MIVHCFHIFLLGNTNGIQVTGDWLTESDLAIEISLLNAALQDASLVIQRIGTFLILDGRGAEIAFPIFDVEAL